MTATELKNLIITQLAIAGLTTDQRNDDLWLAVSKAFVLAGIIGDIMLPINESDVINLVADLAAKANAASLSNVDNTSDMNKPVSIATAGAISNAIMLAGDNVTNNFAPRLPQIAVLTGTVSLASSYTLTNIPTLTASLVVGGKYLVDVSLVFSTGARGGIQVGLGGTVGVGSSSAFLVGEILSTVPALAAVGFLDMVGALSVGCVGPAVGVVRVRGTIVPTSSGTLIVKYAQNEVDSTTTSILYGSSLCVTKQ